MIDKILKEALMLDGNETYSLDNNTYLFYQMLIVELTKIKYNIRYCSNKNCPCHPESDIKKILKKNTLVEFLKDNKLYEDIVNLTVNYEAKIIFDDRDFEF